MNRIESPIAIEIKNPEDSSIDFQQYWFSVKRRWLGATVFAAGFFAVSCIGILKLSQPHYEAEGKILVKPDESAPLTGLIKDTKTQLTPLTMQGNPLKTEAEIILSKPVLNRAIQSIMLTDNKGKPISEEALKANVEVKEITGTDILQISYRNSDSKQTASVVNRIMKAYIENNRLTNRAEALAAKNFIAQQLPATQQSVSRAENALRRFQEKNQIVTLDEEAKLSLETVEKLKSSIAEAQAKLVDANAQQTDLITKLGMNPQQAILVGKLSQSKSVQGTLSAIQKLSEELTLNKTRYQNENPRIIDLEEKVANLKRQLQIQIREEIGDVSALPKGTIRAGELEIDLIKKLVGLQGDKLGLSQQIISLESNLSSYKQRLSTLPKLKEQERELQRKVEAAQFTYEALLKKIKEVEAAGNQNIVNARIIEEATVPKVPSLDKKFNLLLLANLIISSIIFVAFIVIMERSDSSVKTVKDIKELFDYTILATIPIIEQRKSIGWKTNSESSILLPILETPDSPISEVYRMLQANLEFVTSSQKPNVIVVSSSVSQEGKSTVAANLAVVFTEQKKRVLLIDADMRHPSQHHAWGLDNEVGLSKVIVNRAELSTAVTKVIPNLDILTSGATPPNPVTLFKSEAMATLIECASLDYDYVIIDAPPILMAADALVLGKMSDGILMVSRPGVVDSDSATNTKALLEQSRQNILGLVINGVILDNESDSYFHLRKNYSTPKMRKTLNLIEK